WSAPGASSPLPRRTAPATSRGGTRSSRRLPLPIVELEQRGTGRLVERAGPAQPRPELERVDRAPPPLRVEVVVTGRLDPEIAQALAHPRESIGRIHVPEAQNRRSLLSGDVELTVLGARGDVSADEPCVVRATVD